jgi:hypothetical protein
MHRTMRNPLADLGSFMHECSEDPVTRVLATTALVLSISQAAGPSMIAQPPGFILINAGASPDDPIDALMKNMVGMSRPEPRPQLDDYERNRRTMKAAFARKQNEASPHKAVLNFLGFSDADDCPWAAKFHKAMAENCGHGRAGWYADRRDPDFGWFTDATGHAILRLERSEDFQQFKEDLRLYPKRLTNPVGYNAQMREELKRLSIAGSLSLADWNDHLAQCVVDNSIPVLFLPHHASNPLVTPGHLALEWIGIALAAEAVDSSAAPVIAMQRLDAFNSPWVSNRIIALRERLRHMSADYEFFIMRAVRELFPCCQRLAGILAPNGLQRQELQSFSFDVFTHVLQGVCLSVECLGWHGYGLECPGGCEPVHRVLRDIRQHGSLSKRDLQRHQQCLTAKSRDAIIAALVKEGLISIRNNQITSLPFAVYWKNLLHRSFDGLPEPQWKGHTPMRETAA